MKKFGLKIIVSTIVLVIFIQTLLPLIGANNSVYAGTSYTRYFKGTYGELYKNLKEGETFQKTGAYKYHNVNYEATIELKDIPTCELNKYKHGFELDTNLSGYKATVSGDPKNKVEQRKDVHIKNGSASIKCGIERRWNATVTVVLKYKSPRRLLVGNKYITSNFPQIEIYAKNYFKDGKNVIMKRTDYGPYDSDGDEYTFDIYGTNPDNASSSNNSSSASIIKQEIINEVQDNYYSWENTWDDSWVDSWDEPYYEPEEVDKEINLNEYQKRLYIRTLYRKVLNRDPRDYPPSNEYDMFLDGNFSPQDIASNTILSDEAHKAKNIRSLSNQEFVKFCYRVILGREGDSGGINSHTNALNNGTRNREKTIRAFFNVSEEFENKWTREVKKIEFSNKETCDAIFNNLTIQGFDVCKLDSTNLLMFEQDIQRVTYLDISGKNLTNINGISTFSNLTKLLIHNNKITDLSDVGKLSKLTCLYLNNNGLGSNVKPVFGLTNLTELHVDNNGLISDYITNISKLTKLQKLTVNNNNLRNLSGISEIGSLKELYADNNKIFDLNGIKVDKISLKNQVVEEEGYGSQRDMFEIVSLAKDKNSLVYTDQNLELQNCKYENGKLVLNLNDKKGTVTIKGGAADGTKCTFTSIAREIKINDKVLADRLQAKLGNIVQERREENGKYYIYISANQGKIIQNLDLSATTKDTGKITDITGLENFENLKSLNLTSNKVGNLDKLSGLKGLESLTIKNNGLKDLNSIKNIKSLKQLDASHNGISDISGLSGLTNLDTVILDSNEIGNNLSALNNLSKLSVLSLSDNGVSSLQNIKGLKLTSFYASNNFLSDFTSVKNDGNTLITAMNNIVDIEIDGTECNIPDIVKIAMDKNGGVSCLELTDCTINNNKVVLGQYKTDAQIKIIKGESSDTIINIKNKKYITPPVVKTSYANVSDGVKVTLQMDRHIFDLWGWTREDDTYTKYSKVFKYNVANQKVVVKDGYGNSTDVLINISSIQNTKVPGLKVTYSETSPTKDNVTVTISADVRLKDLEKSGWKLSADKKSISCTFTENARYGKNIFLESNPSDFTSSGYDANVQINVDNIDKTAPICTVEYSKKELTKSSVIATVWGNEDIELDVKNTQLISKTTKQNDAGKTIYGLTLLYTKNTSAKFNVKDAAGNITSVFVSVTNIDDKIDGLNAVSTGVTATNKNQTIKINANEKIAIATANITIARKGLNIAKRIYADETNLPILKVATTTPIMYLAENEEVTNNSENEISIDAIEGDSGVLSVADNVGNNELVMYNTTNIDKTAPLLSIEKRENQDDGSVKVTIKSNELIQNTEDLNGWILSEDGLRVTKVFKLSTNEKVAIKDLAGNEGYVDLEVEVNALGYSIEYEKIENTDMVLVTIQTNSEIKVPEGWRLLEDKKSIAKALRVNEDETVLIEDYNGYGSKVYVTAYDSLDKERKTIDNTQAKDVIPQTGKYMAFVLIASMILVIITTITLMNYYKKNNK